MKKYKKARSINELVAFREGINDGYAQGYTQCLTDMENNVKRMKEVFVKITIDANKNVPNHTELSNGRKRIR